MHIREAYKKSFFINKFVCYSDFVDLSVSINIALGFKCH